MLTSITSISKIETFYRFSFEQEKIVLRNTFLSQKKLNSFFLQKATFLIESINACKNAIFGTIIEVFSHFVGLFFIFPEIKKKQILAFYYSLTFFFVKDSLLSIF